MKTTTITTVVTSAQQPQRVLQVDDRAFDEFDATSWTQTEVRLRPGRIRIADFRDDPQTHRGVLLQRDQLETEAVAC